MTASALIRITKNTFALSLARMGIVAFTVVFTIFAARVLGVEGFGKYALVRGYFELFLSLASTGLAIVITREIAKRVEWTARYLSTAFALVAGLALASTTLLAILGRGFDYASDTELALWLASLALFPAAGAALVEGAFIAAEKAEYVTVGTIIENILRTALSLWALFAGHGLFALFVVLFVTRSVMVGFYLATLHLRVAKLRWYFDWTFMKQLVRDWRVFALENWFSTLFLSLGVIILSLFHGERAVGPYAAADRILTPVGLFAGSYRDAIFPYLSRSFQESRDAIHRVTEQSVKYMLALVLPGAILISVLADTIIRLLYTDAYAESVPILRVLVWVLVLRFTNPFLSFTLFARGEQTTSLKVAAISFAVYLAVSLWMIPQWGAVGTAGSLLLAMFAAFLLYFFFVFGTARARETLSNITRIALAAGITGVFATALRDSGLNLPLLVTSIAALYILLLFALRVPSQGDMDLFRRMAAKLSANLSVIARSVLSGAAFFAAESKDRDEAISNSRIGDCFAHLPWQAVPGKNARNDIREDSPDEPRPRGFADNRKTAE
ncbi:MAG: oligosaccharide flippase family protein [Chloroflexi bacterium]|nr:oligosaccharide flippase family protein [Chloroflexota bacterium]